MPLQPKGIHAEASHSVINIKRKAAASPLR